MCGGIKLVRKRIKIVQGIIENVKSISDDIKLNDVKDILHHIESPLNCVEVNFYDTAGALNKVFKHFMQSKQDGDK